MDGKVENLKFFLECIKMKFNQTPKACIEDRTKNLSHGTKFLN